MKEFSKSGKGKPGKAMTSFGRFVLEKSNTELC
jgi:hypothetical protein